MTATPRHLEALQGGLLPAQRRQRIVEFLKTHGAVTLPQLEQALAVSQSTLRRDLDGLAAEGVVERTHGGALLRQQGYSTFEPDLRSATELSPAEKRAIGIAAAAALEPQQSVIFDSGTTVLEAAQAVVARGIPLTAVTNDLAIAQVLGAAAGVQVHVLGGQLRAGFTTLLGPAVVEAAAAIHADVLLCGAHTVSNGVLTETSADVAAVKRAFVRAARVRRLLVDASKFRQAAFMRVAPLSDFHELLTDQAVPAEVAEQVRTLGLKLTRVAV
ncbi:MAG: DeoR/GlpR transcriptional regulator [Burkholderiaceae bacterium]|nr:DeoR/GlpR transcriptional regulator [Burkholderiaceae bacterium]